VDRRVVERAKVYARSQGRSLSDLVENYLILLTSERGRAESGVSPKLKAMKGVLKVPDDYDYKKELSDALAKKHLK
jgi:hypothetical protein